MLDGLVVRSGPIDANGVATVTTTVLRLGIHHVTATYSGDANFLGASASFDEAVFGNWYLPYLGNST